MTAEILEGGRRVDENGLIMPWYTSPCLEWLQTLDFHNVRVWEFGVGDSTEWYRSRGCKVSGVDTDRAWAEKCSVRHAEFAAFYCAIIDQTGPYDIIVIDGEWRDECTKWALQELKSGGYLILDNWKQEDVAPDWPITEQLIEGMPITLYKQPDHEYWVTAVVTKP